MRLAQAGRPNSSGLERALQRACEHLASRQRPDGAWDGDYSGPMFLLPMYVAAYVFGNRKVDAQRAARIVTYLRRTQNDDGSIGQHAEASGQMFTTATCYAAMRLLGVAASDPAAERMRCWIRTHGTPLGAAPWGKFVLSLLNLYDYDGLNPIPPELWLLPRSVPVHPSRLWCHCRQVYLPMAYLYGRRARTQPTDLLRSLRVELYTEPYAAISWPAYRDRAATSDRSVPATPLLKYTNWLTAAFERRNMITRPLDRLRQRALAELLEHIRHEDQATSYIRIGPVNAALNTIVAVAAADPGNEQDQEAIDRSYETLDRYLWDAQDGTTRMSGYNSTALWDTAFATQALLAAGAASTHRSVLRRAHRYLSDNQVLQDVPDRQRYFRDPSRGGWPFSDRAHGWPISDCTAEGLKCALALGEIERPIAEARLRDATRLLLSMQNRDGGWATYERQRGGRWLEQLNPSLVFADIMVDYSHVECTSACVQALAKVQGRWVDLDRAIARSINRGARFLRHKQRLDGSWEGAWAVCFTYGTWFGVWGLVAAGAHPTDAALRRAVDFLAVHQNADGGWGEHFAGCLRRRYASRDSHAVNTSWGLLALCRAGHRDSETATRAARWLLQAQSEDGSWPRQYMLGLFNRTTLLNYDNYARYFPLWALAEYRRAAKSDRRPEL